MYSMIARRTRHCLSSASWTMAGRRDCDKSSIPITRRIQKMKAKGETISASDTLRRDLRRGGGTTKGTPSLTSSSLEIICKRTSGNSSFSICRNMGRRCAIVLYFVWAISSCLAGNKGVNRRVSLLFLPQYGSQTTNLSTQRRSDMLRGVGDKVFNARHDFVQKGLSVKQPTKACKGWSALQSSTPG